VAVGDAVPVLAPDHHHVLYSTTTTDLWLLDTFGGLPRRLLVLPARSFLGKIAWSDDSTGLVLTIYTDRTPAGYKGIALSSWALMTLDLQSGQTHILTRSSPGRAFFPQPLGWSRHAGRLFLLEGQDGGAAVYRVLDENGATLERLRVPDSTLQATLSPDDRNVLIATFPYTAGGHTTLSVRPAAHPSRVLVTVRPLRGWLLSSFTAWAPDGRSFAYSAASVQDTTLPTERIPVQLRIADAATGTTRLLRREQGMNTHVLAWSLDGRVLLLGRETVDASHTDSLTLYGLHLDGASEYLLHTGEAAETHIDVVGWARPLITR